MNIILDTSNLCRFFIHGRSNRTHILQVACRPTLGLGRKIKNFLKRDFLSWLLFLSKLSKPRF